MSVLWPIILAEGLDVTLYASAEAIDVEPIDLPEFDAWDASGRVLELVPIERPEKFLGTISTTREGIAIRAADHPPRLDPEGLLARLQDMLEATGTPIDEGLTLQDTVELVARLRGVRS